MQDGGNNLDFIVNDLSINGQFTNVPSFEDSIDRVMVIRNIINQYGSDLYCHRSMAQAQVTEGMAMPQAINNLPLNKKRAFMQWLTRQGPFWEDARNHAPDEWFQWSETIVTDTAVGEAAWCCFHGIERNLVSFIPSDWKFSPVPVEWLVADAVKKKVTVVNLWEPATIQDLLEKSPPPIKSWDQLKSLTTARYQELTFSLDAFEPLKGLPFSSAAAHRIVVLLKILNQFKTCFDDDGKRTREGNDIYQNFFTGKKGKGGRGALFSDSSDSEKDKFGSELTFNDPGDVEKSLSCPWHGKVQTPQLRVHFSYPVRSDKPLYIVYVGEKITKQ